MESPSIDECLDALPGELPVASHGDRTVDAARMRDDVARVAAALHDQPPTPGSPATFAFRDDRYAFAAALLATWRTGRGAMLPADARREFVAPALRLAGGAFLHDTREGRGVLVPPLLARSAERSPATYDGASLHGALLTTVARVRPRCASGTALPPPHGRPELAVRAWDRAQLRLELDRLLDEIEWPDEGFVVSTVSPSSLPGVLLGVLAPLVRGLPFSGAVPRTIEAVAEEVRSRGARVLVGTPGHLQRMLRLPRGSFGRLEVVVTTLGAIDADTGLSDEIRQRHGVRVQSALLAAAETPKSADARRLASALSRIAGVRDFAVVEHGASIAAWIAAPGIERSSLEHAIATHGAQPPAQLACDDRLPRDPNGGLLDADVWRRFGSDACGRKLPLDLEWSEALDVSRWRVVIPTDSAWFDGHFPGNPVLAGAVQLQELVLPALRRCAGAGVRVRGWNALKFAARIVPGDALEVSIDVDAGAARFVIRRGAETCASGSLVFDRTEQDGARAAEPA